MTQFYKIAILFFVILSSSCRLFSHPDLPQLGKIPDFKFLNQKNEAVTIEALKGKVSVVNFIFTSCAGTCPLLTEQMKKVQAAMLQQAQKKPDILKKVQIISFSVDPERDTPAKLEEYAKSYGVDSQLWSFLTGPLDDIRATVIQGFKISMQKVDMSTSNPEAQKNQQLIEDFDVVHSEKFVLVDQNLNIRGYYDADTQGLTRLISDMKFLAGI